MQIKSKWIALLLALIAFEITCTENNINQQAKVNSIININNYQTIMPQAPGYNEFEANCITCHSLRYIEMQPDFPIEKWQGIVDKMRKNFGAPIPDSTAAKIVAYLAQVKSEKN